MDAQNNAIEIRAKAGLSEKDLPVDLLKVTNYLGLEVYYAEFADSSISGMLITDQSRVPSGIEPGKKGTIFLKSGEYPPRSRFTLAHEIGHFALDHGDGLIADFYRGKKTGYNSSEEKEANAFAAELLMPKVMFTQLWESGLSLEELTIVFGVSAAAIVTRARALQLYLKEYAY